MATAAPPRPSDRESTATVDEGTTCTWLSHPTDAFVEILLRLPPSTRRWVRLVCRHWCAVIDERTPPPQSKPAVLACFTSYESTSAYVIDDIATGRCRHVWGVRADPNATAYRRQHNDVTMVGTCNGLLCLCDNTTPGGAISLLNPATRARDATPPAAARLPPAKFDHEDERVALAVPLPVVGGPGSGYILRLMEAHGRLGLAVSADRRAPAKTEIWVLGRQGWSRQYSVQVQEVVCQRLAGPHFAHGGYVLTASANECGRKHVFAHKVHDTDAAGRLQSGEVTSLRIREQGTVAAYCKEGDRLRTFAYAETTEPLLSVLKRRQQITKPCS